MSLSFKLVASHESVLEKKCNVYFLRQGFLFIKEIILLLWLFCTHFFFLYLKQQTISNMQLKDFAGQKA